MITLRNFMLSCSERELDWTVSKRCTITFLILNGFEHHLVSRAATTQNKVDPCRSRSSVASALLPATCDILAYSHIYMQYIGATRCVFSSLAFQALRAELTQENGTMVPFRCCKACAQQCSEPRGCEARLHRSLILFV